MKKILFILLFTISICFAESSIITDSLVYILLGVLLSFAIISISFMVGKILNQIKFIHWAKTEITNTIISIFLIFIILGSMFAFLELSDNIFEKAYIYLDSQTSKGISYISELTRSSLNDQFESTYYAFIGTPFTSSGGAGKSYRAYYLSYSTQKDIVVNIIFATIVSLEVQKIILQLIENLSFSLFLPIGIVLRVFPATRDIGNFIFAFVIGAAFILPMTYLLYSSASNTLPISAPIDFAMGDITPIAILLPQAIFFPNLSLVILITSVMAIYKGFKQILV
ncbi:hypothetical protein KO317_00505 [Candidatus Micrarchaeota archaeon]|jgi:hypothetical protein|nr:hypothetical protein [Candidatus Micrarchaeota archaeon]